MGVKNSTNRAVQDVSSEYKNFIRDARPKLLDENTGLTVALKNAANKASTLLDTLNAEETGVLAITKDAKPKLLDENTGLIAAITRAVNKLSDLIRVIRFHATVVPEKITQCLD